MALKWIDNGTRIYEGNYVPTTSESCVDSVAYSFGIMQFFIDRASEIFYFLQSIDSGTNLQTWVPCSFNLNSIMAITLLLNIIPTGRIRQAYADYDPTPNETIDSQFFDISCGLPWWNYSNGKVWNCTAYSSNGDGTFTQTWTQIV